RWRSCCLFPVKRRKFCASPASSACTIARCYPSPATTIHPWRNWPISISPGIFPKRAWRAFTTSPRKSRWSIFLKRWAAKSPVNLANKTPCFLEVTSHNLLILLYRDNCRSFCHTRLQHVPYHLFWYRDDEKTDITHRLFMGWRGRCTPG